MNRKEHTEAWVNARVTLVAYGKKEKLTPGDRMYLVDNENGELKRNMFIDAAFKAGRIREYEYYRLTKQDTTNRLLKAIVLALSEPDKKIEDWLIDLED
ncbi:MAG: hypothetical protein GH144_00060 [Clostridia bacterium]|jgi:hypothetical protein|nr:hypothetical protein [Clostridia bacterium]